MHTYIHTYIHTYRETQTWNLKAEFLEYLKNQLSGDLVSGHFEAV